MDAFEVGEHDVPVESVAVLGRGVFHDGVDDGFLVVIGEVGAAAGAGLGVGHVTSLVGPASRLRSELQEAFDRRSGSGEPQLSGVGIGVDGVEHAVAEVLVD